jgi:hypothetical protein
MAGQTDSDGRMVTYLRDFRRLPWHTLTSWIAVFLIACGVAPVGFGREKDTAQYGAGLIINVPFPEAEVSQVVQDVAQNGIIRGTKEYNRDEYISGAIAAGTAKGFSQPADGGRVFYKVRAHAIDPRNFKDGGDVGSLAVRYVVQAQGDHNTVLRIDAVFVEDFRHTVHQSNGSVETAEYKDIHDHLDSIELMKSQTVEAEKERTEQLARKQELAEESTRAKNDSPAQPVATAKVRPDSGPTSSGALSTAPTSDAEASVPQSAVSQTEAPQGQVPQSLEEHVRDLRRQVERLVKSPGAPLKSAPFHTSSTLQSLTAGTEVMIVISTPYWFGVETHEGQHGWMLRDDLEPLP